MWFRWLWNWRSILKDIVKDELKIPIELVKGYDIPNYVSTETLVICSSYSGNTEETISTMKKCNEKMQKFLQYRLRALSKSFLLIIVFLT